MTKRRGRNTLIWAATTVFVIFAIAGVAHLTGNLPFGTATADTTDDADSLVVADVEEVGEVEVAVPVELALVETRSIESYYRAASVIDADRLVDLVTKVQGQVRTVAVEEGDWVRQGDLLAELENEREKIQLRQAELKLAEQRRTLERQEAMQAEQLISAQAFEDARHACELAEAELDLARVAVEETIVRAPFAGQIASRSIVVGQMVQPGTPLYTLTDVTPLRVRVHLPENIARKVAAGQRVLINPEGVEGDLEARVERIAPIVDPATSTVQLTLRLDEGAEQALVGGFVKVRITTDTSHEALSVPKIALVEEGGLRSVFIAEADSVRKVEVNCGLYDESHIEILDGLQLGQFVVSLGQGGLRTGARVEPLNAGDVGWTVTTDAIETSESDTVAMLEPPADDQ